MQHWRDNSIWIYRTQRNSKQKSSKGGEVLQHKTLLKHMALILLVFNTISRLNTTEGPFSIIYTLYIFLLRYSDWRSKWASPTVSLLLYYSKGDKPPADRQISLNNTKKIQQRGVKADYCEAAAVTRSWQDVAGDQEPAAASWDSLAEATMGQSPSLCGCPP